MYTLWSERYYRRASTGGTQWEIYMESNALALAVCLACSQMLRRQKKAFRVKLITVLPISDVEGVNQLSSQS